ncbi:nitrite reductase (NAD(P)H) small subunit [Tistrella mobilis]|uniref:Rieske 2Fe-2S domain-containing protein n=1 Tax=Tistrella mobilis TaxID=171437 RepID=UPI003556448E
MTILADMTAVLADSADWIDCGTLDDLPLRGARVIRHQGGSIALFRPAEGPPAAIANACPHKGGPLADGLVHGRAVSCPLHGRVFNLDDGRAAAPDRDCVARYPVTVSAEGRVLVRLRPLSPAAPAGAGLIAEAAE